MDTKNFVQLTPISTIFNIQEKFQKRKKKKRKISIFKATYIWAVTKFFNWFQRRSNFYNFQEQKCTYSLTCYMKALREL